MKNIYEVPELEISLFLHDDVTTNILSALDNVTDDLWGEVGDLPSI